MSGTHLRNGTLKIRGVVVTMTPHNIFIYSVTNYSSHSNSRITNVDFPQLLGPGWISVNGSFRFRFTLWNEV